MPLFDAGMDGLQLNFLSSIKITDASIDELRVVVERQRRLSHNAALLARLPDRGQKVFLALNMLEAALAKKES